MAPLSDLKLDHVAFPVRDAEATMAFYRDVLGLPLVAATTGDDWDGYPWLMMVFGLPDGHEIAAVALRGAPAPDYRGVPMDARHYALSVDSEAGVDAWCRHLTQAEVDYWEERHGEQRSIYFTDPDGVILELTWPASRLRRPEDPKAMQAAKHWARTPVSA